MNIATKCQEANGESKNASSVQLKNAKEFTGWESIAITGSFQLKNYKKTIYKIVKILYNVIVNKKEAINYEISI